MYGTLKFIHVSTAVLTITGFSIRAWWMYTDSPKLAAKPVRILPHVVDTIFLASGIALIVTLRLDVLTQPWLLTKFALLFAYIVLGAIALGRGKTVHTRTTALIVALATFAYIYGVAISKSMTSWFAWFGR